MIVEQRIIGPMRNFGYLVADSEGGNAVVIDPSFDARPLQRIAEKRGCSIEVILNTHQHQDHVLDNERLAKETRARIAAHELSPVGKDIELSDRSVMKIGDLHVTVLHTPGHTPDSCCFLVSGNLFTGDTLFVGDCGRVDLPESNVDAMYDSLFNRVLKLDDAVRVCPGHDYGPRPFSTIGDEKRTNYTLKPRTLEDFRKFMREP